MGGEGIFFVTPVNARVASLGQNALKQLRVENLSEVLADEIEALLGS